MSQRGSGGFEESRLPATSMSDVVTTDSATEPRTTLGRQFPDAPASDWAMRMVLHRIADHDGHSAFVLRWLLWLGLAITYGFAHAPWFAWLCLLPGMVPPNWPATAAVRSAIPCCVGLPGPRTTQPDGS